MPQHDGSEELKEAQIYNQRLVPRVERKEFDEIKLNEEYSVFFTMTSTNTVQPHIKHLIQGTDFPIVANSAAGLMALKLRACYEFPK